MTRQLTLFAASRFAAEKLVGIPITLVLVAIGYLVDAGRTGASVSPGSAVVVGSVRGSEARHARARPLTPDDLPGGRGPGALRRAGRQTSVRAPVPIGARLSVV